VINSVRVREEPGQRELASAPLSGRTASCSPSCWWTPPSPSIILAAKSIVRREDMSQNSRLSLAGTLVNPTYSLLVGRLALWQLDLL
jgi:hypothetical protein